MSLSSTDITPSELDKEMNASNNFSRISPPAAGFSVPAHELSDLLSSQPELPPIDFEKMFERCLENVEFAQMLLREFQATAGERVESVIRFIEHSQPADAAFAAHALKSMAGILGATALLNTAEQIEMAGNSAELARLRELALPLRSELQRCLDFIPQILERSASASKLPVGI